MTITELKQKFLQLFPTGEISQTWASIPSLGQLKEESKKLSYQENGVASYRVLKFRFSKDGQTFLSRKSPSSFAATLGVQS